MTALHAVAAVLAGLAGLAAGRLHFAALRSGTEALIRDGSAGRAALLTLGRFALTIAVLVAAALAGAVPLLAAALGFGLGRAWELRARGRR